MPGGRPVRAEDLVARYAARWGIEQASADARHIVVLVEYAEDRAVLRRHGRQTPPGHHRRQISRSMPRAGHPARNPGRPRRLGRRRNLINKTAEHEITLIFSQFCGCCRKQARRDSAWAWVAAGAAVSVKAFARRYGVDRYTAYEDLISSGSLSLRQHPLDGAGRLLRRSCRGPRLSISQGIGFGPAISACSLLDLRRAAPRTSGRTRTGTRATQGSCRHGTNHTRGPPRRRPLRAPVRGSPVAGETVES